MSPKGQFSVSLDTLADLDRSAAGGGQRRLVRVPRLDRTRLQENQARRLAVAIHPHVRSRPRRTVMVGHRLGDLVAVGRRRRERRRHIGRNVAASASSFSIARPPSPANQRLPSGLESPPHCLAHQQPLPTGYGKPEPWASPPPPILTPLPVPLVNLSKNLHL